MLTGKIFKLGRDIDTDAIIAARYLNIIDLKELARHALEDLDPGFMKRVGPGDFIFADFNFGCGSSREQAPRVLKEIGIGCIVAKSFARIFYRNAINIGLPILISPQAVDAAQEGDRAEIDTGQGIIRINQRTFQAEALPDFFQEIFHLGGLMQYVKKQITSGG